jgi:hypothetical protein
MSDWQKPAFTELAMNAEIGSYQEDTGGRGNPPIVDERGERPGVFTDEEQEPEER